MTKKHLLWWVLNYLQENHMEIIEELHNLEGDKQNQWVKEAINERLNKFFEKA